MKLILNYIIIISFLLIFIYIFVKYRNLKNKYQFLKEQFAKQNHFYKENELFCQDFKSNWHDFKNHMICINSMLQSQEYDNLKDYLLRIYDSSDDFSFSYSTGNLVLDSILKEKSIVSKKHQIEFLVHLNLPEKIQIEQTDLCIVLGNLMDNAIEACLKIQNMEQKKEIYLTMGFQKDYLTISIKNSQGTNHGMMNSDKGRYGHGLGLKNVKKVVEKYSGNLSFEQENSFYNVYLIMKNIEIQDLEYSHGML